MVEFTSHNVEYLALARGFIFESPRERYRKVLHVEFVC